MGSEELRQNVFSSILMSTKLKSSQASLTYPSCSFCGGSSSAKGSPKRKSLLCQLSLYVNPSESFIVWGKKQDEPKGMMWLRSCCVRRGQEEGAVELISRGCRGRCSYTIKLSSSVVADEWYRLLRGESRRVPTVADDVPTDEDDRMSATLDAILTEMAPSTISDSLLEEESETDNDRDYKDAPQMAVEPAVRPSKKSTKTKKHSKNRKSTPVLCNPLQGLVSRKTSCPVAVVGSYSASIYPLDSTEANTPSLPELEMTRWSWPQTL